MPLSSVDTLENNNPEPTPADAAHAHGEDLTTMSTSMLTTILMAMSMSTRMGRFSILIAPANWFLTSPLKTYPNPSAG